MNVHSNFIHSSQILETTKIFTCRRNDKQIVIYLRSDILLSNCKERNSCNNTEEEWQKCWEKKARLKYYTVYDSVQTKFKNSPKLIYGHRNQKVVAIEGGGVDCKGTQENVLGWWKCSRLLTWMYEIVKINWIEYLCAFYCK